MSTLGEEILLKSLAAAGDAIMITDDNGIVLYVNRTFEETTGYTLVEVLGKTPQLWKSNRHDEDFYQIMWNTILSGNIWKGEVTNKRKDGSFYQADLIIVPIEDSKQQKYFVGVHNDITRHKNIGSKLKKLNQQIKEESLKKGNYFSHIVHDIRGPVGAMLGILEEFEEEGLSKDQKESIQTLLRASQNVLGLVNDILDYSKIEAGKMVLAKKDLSVPNIVEQIAKLYETRAHQKGLDLFWHIDERLKNKIYEGDADKIHRIVSNLLSNALKFTHVGSVKIQANLVANSDQDSDQTETVSIKVIDTGIGIAEEKHEKIFDQYTQSDNSISEDYGGTGLGLSICRLYSQLMEGDITVDSEPGIGSVFEFKMRLKITSTNEVVDEVKHVASKTYTGRMALVCEDEEFSQLYLRKLLMKMGFDVLVANNGENAVATYKENRNIELILMDSRMPVMDGFEATAIIRHFSDYKNSPIIIGFSGLIDQKEKDIGLEAGMNDFLQKGSRPYILKAIIAKWLS